MGHHQLIVLIKKRVQGIQREPSRSQASGLLEANLILGQILGLGEGAKALVTGCGVCARRNVSHSGHQHLLPSPFTVPKWPSCALIQDSMWWFDVCGTGFILSCSFLYFRPFQGSSELSFPLFRVLSLSRWVSVPEGGGRAGKSCSLWLKGLQLLLVMI